MKFQNSQKFFIFLVTEFHLRVPNVIKTRVEKKIIGKGDLIGPDLLQPQKLIPCNADVKATAYCDIRVLNIRALVNILTLYPEFAMKFAENLELQLAFNLKSDVS